MHNELVILLFCAIFVFCILYIKKNYDKSKLSKLNWKKLFAEFYAISLIFAVSSLIFGSFGINLRPENIKLFILLFLVFVPAVVGLLYRIYYKQVEYLLACNRAYELITVANIILGIIYKIF